MDTYSKAQIFEDVTLGVSCKGNLPALTLCLAGVLNAAVLPANIQIRLEGSKLGLNTFYLEQLGCLARLLGVSFSVNAFTSTGVRDSRDWQLVQCPTEYLWLVDDDVVPHSLCLQAFTDAVKEHLRAANAAYLAGSKPDVSNLRGYPGFSFKRLKKDAVVEGANHSMVYDVIDCYGAAAKTEVLDTGNVFFKLAPIRKAKCTFRQFPDSRNPSGDATTFSLVLAKAKLTGMFVPSALAYHLEKPGKGFNEFEARAEMLLRTCDVKGLDKGIVRRYFMPKIWS
jgi:hypothetical protein